MGSHASNGSRSESTEESAAILKWGSSSIGRADRRGHWFFYFNDDGDLVSLRVENWKVVFMEQRAPGTMRVWAEPFTPLRVPKLFDLRADPYERADVTSNTYYDWLVSQPYLIFAAQAETAKFLDTFKDYPPRQRAPSFSVDRAVQKMKQNLSSD